MEMDVGDLFDAVWRRRRLAIPAFALTFGLAGLYLFATPARYAAQMAILVDTRERPPIGADAAPIPQNPDPALIESQMRLISSNEVLRRVVEREQLRRDPEFEPKKPSAAVETIKALLGLKPGPQTIGIDAIVKALAESIVVKHSEKSYVLDVEVRSSAPEKAERLARALSEAYFETQSKIGDDIVEKQSDWLDGKLKDLRDRLEKAEQRAEAYRKAQSLLVTDGHIPPEEQMKDANAALVEARGKRADQEARYAQLQAAIRAGGSIESLGEAIRSPLIEKLRTDYAALAKDAAFAQTTLGPRHPSYMIVRAQIEALRRQISAELRRISGSMEHDLKAARDAEQSAARLVADLTSAIDRQGGARLELSEMTRKVNALREQYEKALSARENVRKDIIGSPYGVVINQPVALKGRVSPKTAPALMIALATGLNLFVVASLILEFLQRKRSGRAAPGAPSAVSAPKERVFQEAAPAIVAALPQIDAAMTRASAPQAWFECLVEVMEGGPYRRVVADVYDALWRERTTGGAATLVVVASREGGVGVTTFAAALALFACAQGERTLLLDCDAERPTLASAPPIFAPARGGFGSSDPLSLLHSESGGAGKVLLGRIGGGVRPWPREAYFRSKFDLVILDCGVLDDEFAASLDDEVDAAIMIERTRDGDRKALALVRRNLAEAPAVRRGGVGGDAGMTVGRLQPV